MIIPKIKAIGIPIKDVLGPRIKNSLVLASAAIFIGIPIALILGIITALWRTILFHSILI